MNLEPTNEGLSDLQLHIDIPQYMIEAGLTSIELIDAALQHQEQSGSTRTQEDVDLVNRLGSINNEGARTLVEERYVLLRYFLKRYHGRPRWMQSHPSTQEKRKREREWRMAT